MNKGGQLRATDSKVNTDTDGGREGAGESAAIQCGANCPAPSSPTILHKRSPGPDARASGKPHAFVSLGWEAGNMPPRNSL